MKQLQTKKGFTIIEVVLVLAIAALIFLMVFIALPALQRSQRDTQRRHDLDRVVSQITSYQTNNRNKLPGTDKTAYNADFKANYMKSGGDLFQDPDGTEYSFENGPIPTGGSGTYDNTKDKIYINAGAVCDGENVTSNDKGASKVAFQMRMEGGGVACVNN